LSYAGLGAIQSFQNMSVAERDWHYKKLVETKKEEKESQTKREQEVAQKFSRSPRAPFTKGKR